MDSSVHPAFVNRLKYEWFLMGLLFVGAILIVISGCNQESETSETDVNDSAIEVQIAVRSTPFKTGDEINSGEYRVVSSNLLPISGHGSSHVVSVKDGVWVEMKWSNVELYPKDSIMLRDFKWRIRNPLKDKGGDTRTFGWYERIEPDSQGLSTEFDHLVTPTSLRHTKEERETGPVLVVRTRWLPQLPHVKEIALE